jgi:hypothetical protein
VPLLFFSYSWRIVRSLPEHAVDAWVAVSICSTFPNARIWAPTPASLRDGGSRAQLGEGRSFVLENKATELVKPGNDHVIEINRAQLDRYCELSGESNQSPIYYVLPDPPWFVVPRQDSPVPIEAAQRTTPVPFKEWAWVVPCHELRSYLGGTKSIRTSTLPRTGWSTLASFLKDVKESRPGRKSEVESSVDHPAESESSSGRELRNRDTLMAVFLPKEDLPNWDGGGTPS